MSARIRQYEQADLEHLRRFHASQGFDYELPAPDGDLFVSKLVAENSTGPCMALLLRVTSEAYMLHDPAHGSPEDRQRLFLALHQAMKAEALAKGLDDVCAWLPPEIEKSFGKRLMRMGWQKQLWPCYSLLLREG